MEESAGCLVPRGADPVPDLLSAFIRTSVRFGHDPELVAKYYLLHGSDFVCLRATLDFVLHGRSTRPSAA